MADKTENEILKNLISLSHRLGKPERGLAMIGEGNISALLPDGTYYLKASGSELGTIKEEDFVRLKQDTVLALLQKGNVLQMFLWFIPETEIEGKVQLVGTAIFLFAVISTVDDKTFYFDESLFDKFEAYQNQTIKIRAKVKDRETESFS